MHPGSSEAGYVELVAETRWATAHIDRYLKENEEYTRELLASLKVLTCVGLVLAVLPPLAIFVSALLGETAWFSGAKVLQLLPTELAAGITLLHSRLRSNDIVRERSEHMNAVMWATSLVVSLGTRQMDQLRGTLRPLAETERNRVLSGRQTTEERERNRWLSDGLVSAVGLRRRRRPKLGKVPRGDPRATKRAAADAAAASKAATGN